MKDTLDNLGRLLSGPGGKSTVTKSVRKSKGTGRYSPVGQKIHKVTPERKDNPSTDPPSKSSSESHQNPRFMR